MKILFLILLIAFISSCHPKAPAKYDESRELVPNPEGYKKDSFIQAGSDSAKPVSAIKDENKYFPFELSVTGGKYVIVAQIEGKE